MIVSGSSRARAAIKEGVIVGGGLTLLKLSSEISEMKTTEPLVAECVHLALSMPLYQLGVNAMVDPDALIESLWGRLDDYGYNAKSKKFGNLREEGVFDAVSVVKSSLRAAVSIASMVILTEVLVADL